MREQIKNITLQDTKITFRNFSGSAKKYNREGDRNFAVILTEEQAEELAAAGWNVKVLAAREEGDSDTHFIKVKVKFGDYPPSVYLVKTDRLVPLNEATIGRLDWAVINKVDLKLNASYWDNDGDQIVTIYLKDMYVSIIEDELESKYAHLKDAESEQGCVGPDCPVIDPEELAAYHETADEE